jgi:hypothetical protein
MIEPNFTEKIDCPCKNGGNAFRDSFDKIEVSICSTCGLMTTSQYQDDSEQMESIKALCPPEIIMISVLDENGFRWFPSVLPFSKKGVIYAEPKGKDSFRWFVAPVVKVAEAEGYMYMDPETNKPYENRIATEKAIIFERNEFMKALELSDTTESKNLLNRINSIFNKK